MNLFCLPYAGGSKSAYHRYVQQAPDGLNVILPELPGRGIRYSEPLLTDLNAMVDDIMKQIRADLYLPYALYGHSMGTLLCYLLAKKIMKEGLNMPLHLFLTGGGAPSTKENRRILHSMSQADLVEKLKEMGGMPDIVLNDHKLLDLFLPIIRADFKATESFVYGGPAGLNIPITAITGDQENISDERVAAWQLETSARLDIKKLPGDHFFIFNYGAEILEMIARALCMPSAVPGATQNY